jgi:CRISPR system Cascade subunit CasA
VSFSLRWSEKGTGARAGTLFAFFAALARGDVDSMPGLRPHQREPLHAFIVQVATLALLRAGSPAMPHDEAGWRDLLLALTPEWPGGEAWTLTVDDWTQPALLQSPIARAADAADYRTTLPTPDALDMLVTSRNHDIKAAQMAEAADEDWFFALLTLQTTEGFLGAGNYGISRMNGGFASRMVLGVRVQGSLAAAWRRDVERLMDHAKGKPGDGTALLWLPPWDGMAQLRFDALDPLYVEICRRIRLRRRPDGGLEALAAGSKVARVAASALKGITGDPWAPIKADGSSSVTPTAAGFGYRQITRLLAPKETTRPLLAEPAETDPPEGLALVAAALVRGQGKTEGLHRRVIPFSRSVFQGRRGDLFLDRMCEVFAIGSVDAGQVGARLRLALLALVQGGPADIRRDDKAGTKKIDPWMAGFDREVDRAFFDDLFWAEVERTAVAPRLAWRKQLRAIASATLDQAADAAPHTAERRIRARARALNLLDASLNAFVENTADGA